MFADLSKNTLKGLVVCLFSSLILTLYSLDVRAQEQDQQSEQPEATQENAPPSQQAPTSFSFDSETQGLADFTFQFFDDEFATLSFEQRDYIFKILESEQAVTKGTIWYLSDSQASRGNIAHLLAMARYTASKGWHSALVLTPDFFSSASNIQSMEETSDSASPNNSDSNQPNIETQTTDAQMSADDHEITCQQPFAAFYEALQTATGNSSPRNIIVADGRIGYCALGVESNVDDINSLVLLNPFLLNRKQALKIEDLIADAQIPILDLVSQSDNPWSIKLAKTRVVAARKALKPHYRQRQIVHPYSIEQYASITGREIYAWLTYLGY